MPTRDYVRVSVVRLIIDGASTNLVSSGNPLFVDPNAEPWPEKWAIQHGEDGSSILIINN